MKLDINILKDISLNLPDRPGVYQFFNDHEEIIYVGKAKSLKKRVSSYFNKNLGSDRKLFVLVNSIFQIKHIVVNTESDALLLENNLIKEYHPRYNILLKDDKTYPWICIKNEPFPRIFLTRKMVQDGSAYFGPYTSALMVRTLLNLIRQLYQIRTCSLNLTEESIKNNRFKVCLEYHLGNCKGPCVGFQSFQEYEESIRQIKAILKGNIHQIIDYLEQSMKSYAEGLNFEMADKIKQKIEILTKFQSKSMVVNPALSDIDIISIENGEKSSFANFMRVVKGSIVYSHTLEFAKRLNESKEEILQYAFVEMRERTESTSKEVIVPFDPEIEFTDIKFVVPKMGDKRKLLELSERNLRLYKIEKEKRKDNIVESHEKSSVLTFLKKDLNLEVLPIRIECFDNSNIQGTNAVAACVVFLNGKPAKSEYRHFNVKTVEGPDDFATMEEIIYRRYSRLINEGKELPQLIVIDGGKGQLSSALNSLNKLGIADKVQIIGIAKRLEEIFKPGESIPLYLDRNSPSLKILQHIRNEAHRFGIEFHRLKRSGSMLQSELENIKGVGEKTIKLLFDKFESVETIKSLTLDQLKEPLGLAKAKVIFEYFNHEPVASQS